MSFLSQAAYASEVCVVDVRIHSEKTLEHGSDYVQEVGRERHAILLREDPCIIHLYTPQEDLGRPSQAVLETRSISALSSNASGAK